MGFTFWSLFMVRIQIKGFALIYMRLFFGHIHQNIFKIASFFFFFFTKKWPFFLGKFDLILFFIKTNSYVNWYLDVVWFYIDTSHVVLDCFATHLFGWLWSLILCYESGRVITEHSFSWNFYWKTISLWQICNNII